MSFLARSRHFVRHCEATCLYSHDVSISYTPVYVRFLLLLFVLLSCDEWPATSLSLVEMVSRLQNNYLVDGRSSLYWHRSH